VGDLPQTKTPSRRTAFEFLAAALLRARHNAGARTSGLTGTRYRRWSGQAAFALQALASQLTGAAHGLGLLASLLLRGLLVVVAQLHLTEDAFALQLLLERAQRLINVIIANDYLQRSTALSKLGHVGLDRGAGAKQPRRRPAGLITVGRSIAQPSGLVHWLEEKNRGCIMSGLALDAVERNSRAG
jgi:hypothetical protein